MITRVLALFLCAASIPALLPNAHAADADAPRNLNQLARWRELWPTEVTIQRGAQFQNGSSIRKGQVVVLDQVTPQGLRLDDGKMFFMYTDGDTDVMQRVNALFNSLTPEQRALKINDVRRNKALWPTRATTRWAMTLDGGTQIAAGKELAVLGFLPDGRVQLADMEQNVSVPMDPWESDLFARARARVGQTGDVSFSYRLLESMLDPSDDGSTVADYDYIVMYDGRDTCSRSVAFAPELAKFQEASSASGAKWLLVLGNAASEPAVNRAHYRNMGLGGRAAKDGWGPMLYQYFQLGGYPTPWFYVYDRDGNQIATAGAAAASYSEVLDFLSAKVTE
ncbi:MAG: hypothetical protein KJO76_01835 [Gammaproteobacteria bacterium]|nr:hypothetical protein [Gammaproteobacteria bacterium]NND36584.1 hypothetical protein [Gammaproteobacteria bacterium]